MKKELIGELFQKFEQARYLLENVECWSARDLQEIACENAGAKVADHFVDVNKMVPLGSGSESTENNGGAK